MYLKGVFVLNFFTYGETEINFLKKKDKKLSEAIDKIGIIQREVEPNLFSALINSIIGQQISTKAHETIWNRVKNGLGNVTPQSILSCTDEELQSFGTSFRKVSYIRGVAERVDDGRLDIEGLKLKSDVDVCKELTSIPGVGTWTAEMLMIFSMQRPNILSYGDLAILRGMRILYRHKKITKELFEKYRRRYSPYASVSSLYLWAIAGGAIPEMKDFLPKK